MEVKIAAQTVWTPTFPAVQETCSIDEYVAPVTDDLAIYVDIDLI